MKNYEFIENSIGEIVYVNGDGDLAMSREYRKIITTKGCKIPLKVIKLTKAGFAYLMDSQNNFYSVPPRNVYQELNKNNMKKQKLINMLMKKAYPFTPDEINDLEPYEVFVFGSNLRGNHYGGAAKLALLKFGAIMGQGEGLQGQSYAFPTLNKEMEKIDWFHLEDYVDNLIDCAKENPTKVFLLTKVGCGIAGFSEEEMIPHFQLDLPPNIIKPINW